MIYLVNDLVKELEALKKVNAYKYHVADDFKSFDTAIDIAIDLVQSYEGVKEFDKN